MRKLLCLTLLAAMAACNQQIIQPAARLRGPADAVVAGTEQQYFYMAGGVRDALYVLELKKGVLNNLTNSIGAFVRAPNKFFPLEIPVDSAPTALQVTPDGAYVIVVCSGTSSIRLVEADTQSPVFAADGEPLRAFVGRGAAAILRDPTTALPAGTSRYYVSNAADESVSVLEVVQGEGAPSLNVVQTFTDTGVMVRMALAPDGTLYGADPSSGFVHSFNVLTQARGKIDVGGPSVEVAVASGGAKLLVAKPESLSVEVYNTATGAIIDSNPVLTPLLPPGEDFKGIYIADLPRRITVVNRDEVSLTTHCSSTDILTGASNGTEDQPRSTDNFAMVAADSGRIYFINVGAAGNDLMYLSYCDPPDVAANESLSPGLFSSETYNSPFVPCRPNTRNNVVCDPESGISMAVGNTIASTWTMVWEAIIPGADRTTGGGQFLPDGTGLFDVSSNLADTLLDVGDRIIITSPPRATPECQEAYPTPESLEFGVAALEDLDGQFTVRLDRPALPQCFPETAGGVSYLSRLGNSFVVELTAQQQSTVLGRLRAGEEFGAGTAAVKFRVRPDYVGTRGGIVSFRLRAPFLPMVGGRVSQSDGVSTSFGPVGRIPTSLQLANIGETGVLVAMAVFGGNDVIVVFQPTDSVFTESSGTVLR